MKGSETLNEKNNAAFHMCENAGWRIVESVIWDKNDYTQTGIVSWRMWELAHQSKQDSCNIISPFDEQEQSRAGIIAAAGFWMKDRLIRFIQQILFRLI
jgi:hypothetical protein